MVTMEKVISLIWSTTWTGPYRAVVIALMANQHTDRPLFCDPGPLQPLFFFYLGLNLSHMLKLSQTLVRSDCF